MREGYLQGVRLCHMGWQRLNALQGIARIVTNGSMIMVLSTTTNN